MTAAAWTCNGAHLLTGSAVTTARLWNAETQQCLLSFSGHVASVKDLRAHPVSPCAPLPPSPYPSPHTSSSPPAFAAIFATCSRDGSVRLWDVRESAGHAALGFAVDDGWRVPTPALRDAAAGQGRRCKRARASVGGPPGSSPGDGRPCTPSAPHSPACGPAVTSHFQLCESRTRLLTSPGTRARRRRGVGTGGAASAASSSPRTRRSPSHTATSVAFTPDGLGLLCAGSTDSDVRLWDMRCLREGTLRSRGAARPSVPGVAQPAALVHAPPSACASQRRIGVSSFDVSPTGARLAVLYSNQQCDHSRPYPACAVLPRPPSPPLSPVPSVAVFDLLRRGEPTPLCVYGGEASGPGNFQRACPEPSSCL